MFNEGRLKNELQKGIKTFPQLARALYVNKKDNRIFSKWLFSLTKKGVIFQNTQKNFFIPKFKKIIQGVMKLNGKGFGFVEYIVDKEKCSTFISSWSINTAMDLDEVEVKIFQEPTNEKLYQGVVTKVITRNKKTFVGRIVDVNGSLSIVPHDIKIKGPFKWENQHDVKVNYEMKVEILKYGYPLVIKPIKTIGHMQDISIDILAEIEEVNLPYEFAPETILETNNIPQSVLAKDLENREDIRDRLIITVDGDDTKDFDDAIEVKKLKSGNYYLGVHIADVTHYVKEETALDKEAQNRGTSVYLADRVIPMLPKVLSNGICSLNPDVDRLTISCECEIDPEGNTVNYKIFPSVIKSKYRLTYQDVNKYYRNNFSWNDSKLHKMLDEALELSKIIRLHKEKEGYIDFEINESKIIIDPNGKTKDIVSRERFESEILIEDFMVRANEVVAHHVQKNKLPFIYRIHDKPDLEKVANLQGAIKILGMDITIPQVPTPAGFAEAIKQIKVTRFDDFMKIMMLRTMAKAEYSSKNIGHFGLASKSYSHFTSPIRRYPDLIAHRMLRTYFFKNNKKEADHFAKILPSISEHSSFTEERAVQLERKVADIKKAEFYEQFIGQTFEGTIVSILKFGFFVEFPNKVGGLVHTSALIDGDYKLTNGGYSLTSNKRKFTIGDKVNTTVVGAIKNTGKIDLVLTDLYDAWLKKRTQINIE